MEPLNILILGRDPDVFPNDGRVGNDTHERHVRYVRELQRRRPGSEARIVVHTFGAGRRVARPIPGMEIHGTQSRNRLTCPLGVARLIRSFHREGWIPDVISCQTGYEEAPIALWLAKRRSRIQVQVHSDYYGAAYRRAGLMQDIHRRLIRWSIRRCDQVRAVSRGVEREILDSRDIGPERIVVAPVPVVFQAAERKMASNRRVVLFVGRLVPDKDLGLWCDVAERVHHARPDVEFWIVGEGNERAMLERRMPAFEGKMRLLGQAPYSELPPIYAEASAFLLTSAYEGLGRVVVEAMLAKVPVVSVDIVGPRDLIEDRRTGRLVARDAKCLAEALIELLTDRRLAGQIAAEAHTWAKANYDFDVVAAKLVDSWEAASLLPRRRA